MSYRVVPVSEDEFMSHVIQFAQLHGWIVAHFRKARTVHGWRTPVQANGKGWPDLALFHEKRKRRLFVECKREDGRLTPEQKQWLKLLDAVGEETHVWKPSDWPEIEKLLRGQ